MNNSEYYYDAPQDDEDVLEVNCIDPERQYSGDPFDIIAAMEEETGCPLTTSCVRTTEGQHSCKLQRVTARMH
jgi:hypothetical protein